MGVAKIPQIVKERRCFFVDDNDKDWSDLNTFEKGLSMENRENKTEEEQIETNIYRRH